MLVDAHHHFWQVARGDYGWLTPDMPICRDYTIADLRPLLGDVSATVLVQAAPTEAETAFLLDAARQSAGLVRGVVGWTDLAAADAAARVAAMGADSLLKGLRPMVQDIAETQWLLHSELQPAFAAMARAGLRLDLLVQPRHLTLLPAFARRYPDLTVVIDHAAKPDIAHGALQPWADDMAAIAKSTGWFCKFSGLVTEAGADWDVERLRPYAEHLLAAFGPERLIWGSDWPVVNLAGGYGTWHEAARTLVPARDHAPVFGANAVRFYAL